MMGLRLTAALAFGVVILPRIVGAQDATPTFDELQHLLKIGQAVVVTDSSGQTVKGSVVSLSPSSITLDLEDGMEFPNGRRTMEESAVQRLARRDPVTEGLLLGLAAGVGATWGGVRYTCGPPGYDDECMANAWGVLALAFIPAGMVAGALIDRLIGNGAVYLAPGAKAAKAIAVAPWITKGRAGMSMSVAF